MDESLERMFNKIAENSHKVRQQENIKRIRVEENKIKAEKKERFRRRAYSLFALAAILATLTYSTPQIVDAVNRQNELNGANYYMNIQMDFVCPELDRVVKSDGTVSLLNSDEKTFNKLSEELINKFGLSRDCAIYVISKKYGNDGFNKVVRSYGYKDKDDFLYKKYAHSTSVSESGQTVYAKEGSYRYFENSVQQELVNNVNKLKEMVDSINYESKGL